MSLKRVIEKTVLTSVASKFRTVLRPVLGGSVEDHLQQDDPWFHSHYVWAANIVVSKINSILKTDNCNIIDFGCGDGIMALGVRKRIKGSVTGIDLTNAFESLPDKAKNRLDMAKLPEGLSFVQINPDQPLPFKECCFDGGYSWSVFEHVIDIEPTLAEVFRILKPGAPFFLQIAPLYTSPFGSHMKRLVDEPWAHLSLGEKTYLERLVTARDLVAGDEKDGLYHENAFDDFKKYLIDEYTKLNKLTVDQLLSMVLSAGFNIKEMQTTQVNKHVIPQALLDNYSEYDLRTNEVILVLTK